MIRDAIRKGALLGPIEPTARGRSLAHSIDPPAGTRIVVVGGCGGIGRALVAASLAMGHCVTVLDLAPALVAAPPPPGAAHGAMDVADPASVAAAFGAIGAIDALVNLAGFAPARAPVVETDPATWAEVLETNLTGAFRVAQAAMPKLRAAATLGRPAALVHVASGLAARLRPGYGAYGASKAGLIALTKSLAIENAPLVRANVVAPGAVDTVFLHGGAGREGARATLDTQALAAAIPMGRIAMPADVAGPILFLCGPGSVYMTGQVLWINGGGHTP